MNKMKYQRFLQPGFKPFDPLELARETEKIVTRKGKEGLERKYVGIYSAPVYRGIATGYAEAAVCVASTAGLIGLVTILNILVNFIQHERLLKNFSRPLKMA